MKPETQTDGDTFRASYEGRLQRQLDEERRRGEALVNAVLAFADRVDVVDLGVASLAGLTSDQLRAAVAAYRR